MSLYSLDEFLLFIEGIFSGKLAVLCVLRAAGVGFANFLTASDFGGRAGGGGPVPGLLGGSEGAGRECDSPGL